VVGDAGNVSGAESGDNEQSAKEKQRLLH
jgi:hypothetical protein